MPEHDAIKWPELFHHLFHADTPDSAANEKRRSDPRVAEPIPGLLSMIIRNGGINA